MKIIDLEKELDFATDIGDKLYEWIREKIWSLPYDVNVEIRYGTTGRVIMLTGKYKIIQIFVLLVQRPVIPDISQALCHFISSCDYEKMEVFVKRMAIIVERERDDALVALAVFTYQLPPGIEREMFEYLI